MRDVFSKLIEETSKAGRKRTGEGGTSARQALEVRGPEHRSQHMVIGELYEGACLGPASLLTHRVTVTAFDLPAHHESTRNSMNKRAKYRKNKQIKKVQL